MSNRLLPPCWPNGPQICELANLPAFATKADLMKFFESQTPGVKIAQSYECVVCGHWHMDTVARAPSGESSGTGRKFRSKKRFES